MKFQSTISLLSLALSSVVTAAPSVDVELNSAFPIGFSKHKNARAVGRLFEIDGKVQYFAGTNAWWLAHLSSNKDVDISVTEMVATGYKVARVWGFGDVTELPPTTNTDPNKVYFQLLADGKGTINYGKDGIQRLDYVVSSAEKHGLKLVLPFFNNWGDYGGVAAYNRAFGGNATTWYTDAVSQKVYRNYIKTIVTRYKKSNAIFAWELGNEPRCKECPASTIHKWATETSAYIKSLDHSHMVTLGDEGWLSPDSGVGDGSYAYSGVEGVDWVGNLKIKTLDYATFHLYPESWSYEYTWGTQWIEEHDLLAKASGKPAILEEYGTPFPSNHTETERPWQVAVEKSDIWGSRTKMPHH